MKKIALLLLIFVTHFQSSYAQVFPFSDDFESYSAFNVPTGYSGNITVYLTHGISQSKGLGGYLTNFSNIDSLISPLIGPVSAAAVLEFDWRIMDPFLYPSTAATLAPGDNFDIFVSTDGATWNSIFNINSSNFSGATTFAHEIISLSAYSGQDILFKIQGLRANGSAEFFIDVDNILIDIPGKIETNELSSFSFSPSPATQFVNFSNSTPLTGIIQIVDISGRIVLEKLVSNENSGMIDISSLSSGNYLLKVKAKLGTKILPLVVR